MKQYIKKGDSVKVLSGDDKNKIGVVLRVFPKKDTAIVEGVNVVKKHKKPTNKDEKGSVVVVESPIKMCKLMFYDAKIGKASRVGRKYKEINGKNKLQRYCKKTGEFI